MTAVRVIAVWVAVSLVVGCVWLASVGLADTVAERWVYPRQWRKYCERLVELGFDPPTYDQFREDLDRGFDGDRPTRRGD